MDDPDFLRPSDSPEETSGPASQAGEASPPSEQFTSVPGESGPSPSRVVTLPMVKGRWGVCLVLLMVALADVTIYRTKGFTGLAVFLTGGSVLLCCGVPSRTLRACTCFVWGMLVVPAWRLADCGNNVLLLCGVWLLLALVLSFRGRIPFVFDVLIFAMECLPGGGEFLQALNASLKEKITRSIDAPQARPGAEILFPLAATVMFGSVFVMANPDIVSMFTGQLDAIMDWVADFAGQFSFGQILFWCAVAWLTGGLLRPTITRFIPTDWEREPFRVPDGKPVYAPMYAAWRNTLLVLIVLFAVYLTFESRAFIRRVPPKGFTYSSYAHEGAAWLTVALGMATLTLSVVFRGITMADDRLAGLRRLAMIWTVLNLALAVAVCNRMLIYVDFNGMTRMRVVAFLGIGSVVAGFLLVVVKIYQHQRFTWLLQRQLWVVGLSAWLYAVLPVDSLIHRWNVNQILGGNPAPIVQITAHKLDDACLPVLLPLCAEADPIVSQGVAALLNLRHRRLQEAVDQNRQAGWTAWQGHQSRSLSALTAAQSSWDVFPTQMATTTALQRLSDVAMERYW
ncbi:MAG: DUF4173 domain-containing protein [Planctomycetaceae bacterium]|nr:DUF4173 domain-containing protein [Planctomycetaceae bacterium]